MRAADYDVCIGCHGDLTGSGGAAVAGRGLAAACVSAGLRVLLLGISESARPRSNDYLNTLPDTSDGTPQRNVIVTPRRVLWRMHNACIPGMLARQLKRTERPRLAFVSFSPFWTVAAKRVWPRVPVLAHFCGVLSNCVTFARDPEIRPGLWQRLADWATRRVERRAFAVADRILVPTREHAAEVAAFVPGARERIVENREGCGRPPVSPAARQQTRARLQLDESRFVAAVLGSCDRNKAVDLAVREMPQMHTHVHLVVVGDGPERPRLERLATAQGVADRVHLVGFQQDVGTWLSAADCVVSTSQYDTFPNAIREAMRCGRPVVVPAHDPPHVYAGISGLLGREQAGLLYDRQRVGALAACVNQLASDAGAAQLLAERGRQVAERMFLWDDTLRQLLALAGAEMPRGEQAHQVSGENGQHCEGGACTDSCEVAERLS